MRRRNFWPYKRKYSPDQPRDFHGRFSSGGGGGGGDGSQGGQSLMSGGVGTAAKILAGMIVVAGGIAHFEAYVRRIQKLSRAGSVHEAISLALSPVRRKSYPTPRSQAEPDLAARIAQLDNLSDADAAELLSAILELMPSADVENFRAGLRRQGLIQ